MPRRSKPGFTVDYTDDGAGEAVVLVHSSISGNRQWRALIDTLKDRYRVLAINLYGYGETTRWPGDRPQTLAAQAELALAVCEDIAGPVHLVGHSFGGSVALKAAAALGPRAGRVVLFEPNPFYLLKQHGRTDAHEESLVMRNCIKRFGATGEWARAAEVFAEYWVGDGAWAAMPEKRRTAFTASLMPNFHEWDSMDHEDTDIDTWKRLAAGVLVMRAARTRRSVGEIFDLFREQCPHWSFKEVHEGGHMAPLTHPEAVNPVIGRFLDTGRPD
ncbi:MAG: alpha/beta hydrolase [Betaproteobacteria bacterium]